MSEPRDYRPTVFLPKTDFTMKAGLTEKEPGVAARLPSLRTCRSGRQKFQVTRP